MSQSDYTVDELNSAYLIIVKARMSLENRPSTDETAEFLFRVGERIWDRRQAQWHPIMIK